MFCIFQKRLNEVLANNIVILKSTKSPFLTEKTSLKICQGLKECVRIKLWSVLRKSLIYFLLMEWKWWSLAIILVTDNHLFQSEKQQMDAAEQKLNPIPKSIVLHWFKLRSIICQCFLETPSTLQLQRRKEKSPRFDVTLWQTMWWTVLVKCVAFHVPASIIGGH